MARVAAISWILAAVLIAGLVSYLAAGEPSSCVRDPSGTSTCAPRSLGEALQTVAVWSFLAPVWAPPLMLAHLMASKPSRGLAAVIAGIGILGGVMVGIGVVLLARPNAPPSWDTPWLVSALLIGVPGVVSALAAQQIGRRQRNHQGHSTMRDRQPRRWAEHAG